MSPVLRTVAAKPLPTRSLRLRNVPDRRPGVKCLLICTETFQSLRRVSILARPYVPTASVLNLRPPSLGGTPRGEVTGVAGSS